MSRAQNIEGSPKQKVLQCIELYPFAPVSRNQATLILRPPVKLFLSSLCFQKDLQAYNGFAGTKYAVVTLKLHKINAELLKLRFTCVITGRGPSGNTYCISLSLSAKFMAATRLPATVDGEV